MRDPIRRIGAAGRDGFQERIVAALLQFRRNAEVAVDDRVGQGLVQRDQQAVGPRGVDGPALRRALDQEVHRAGDAFGLAAEAQTAVVLHHRFGQVERTGRLLHESIP